MSGNKNVIITGSRRGIGNACLEKFASNGFNIWACARNQDDLFELQLDSIRKMYGVDIEAVYFDLTDEAARKNALKKIIMSGRQIDALVNCAGVSHGGLIQMTSMDDIRKIFEINFFAQIALMQQILRPMSRQRTGSIVNLCSIAGIRGEAGYIAYGSSKAALAFATRCAAQEMAPYNVRVNGVAPGLTDTDMAGEMECKAKKKMVDASAMKRLGQPQEIADLVFYLCSEQASFITGQIIRIDGGMIW